MTLTKARRSRLGMTWLALALGALALLAMPSLAAAKDVNKDRIPDKWEKRHKLSLKVNQAKKDQDHDQLRNRAEFLAGTSPRNSDSDGDGTEDGDEQAGTIASFDAETGRLVIDLFGTDTIAGFVTGSTEIKCEGDGLSASASSEGSDEGEGESGEGSSGEGEEEPGEDESGSDEESGDDESGDEESGSDEDSDSDSEGSESSDGEGEGEQGDDDGEHGDDDHLCTTAELVPGAVVEEAELKLENGKAVFEEVELSGKEV